MLHIVEALKQKRPKDSGILSNQIEGTPCKPGAAFDG